VQKKIQAEPGMPRRGKPIRQILIVLANLSWRMANPNLPPPIRAGWAMADDFNNKGKPVKQYEPYFTSTHLYEE